MRRIACIFVLSLFAVAPAAVGQNQAAEEVSTKSGDAPRMSKSQVIDAYGKLPLSFEVNEGQSPSEAKFLARGLGYQLFLTQDGAVLALLGPRQDGMEKQTPSASSLILPEVKELLQQTAESSSAPASVVYMQVVGANPAAKIVGADELPGKSNYFIGNDPKKWRPNLSTFAKVKYPDIYPGVDLVYYGNQGQLEYDFVIAPGASLKQVRLAIAGDEVTSGHQRHKSIPMHIDANGDLVAMSANGEMRWQKPVAYQIGADGGKRLVSARFIRKSKQEVGFAVGSYDASKVLVIDPTLVYSTYVAGATPGPYYFGYTGDQAAAVAVDSNGSAYITGLTESGDFPIISGGYQTACKPVYGPGCLVSGTSRGAQTAVFVTKLSPDGSTLVYSTYLGGSYDDQANAIAVDSSGNAYIAGQTLSPDFPTTTGAYQKVCGPRLDQINGFYCDGSHIVSTCGPNAGQNGFVTKLNSTGSALLYSTFLGGSSLNDTLNGIAVDSAGEACVIGRAQSSYDYHPPGGSCGCPNGPGTCDPNINVSASYGYPITPGGFYPGPLPAPPSAYIPWPFGLPSAFTLPPGSVSGFPSWGPGGAPVFSKLSADGSTLLYSTYFGGGYGPVLAGGDQWGHFQTLEPFLTQGATGVAIDNSGDAYVTGYSNASDQCCTQFGGSQYASLPTTPGVLQPHNASSCAGGSCFHDAFVAKFDPSQAGASSLVYSTYLGSLADDFPTGIAVDSAGNAYVSGVANTTSFGNGPNITPSNFPTTPGTLQPNCPGNCNSSYGWVAKLNSTATALDYSTFLSGTTSGLNTPYTIKADLSGNAYVAGQTGSTDFPQQNPLQGYAGPGNDAFVSVLNPTAASLLFSTFLGGSANGSNGATGIALDSSDNIFVTGSTQSSSFPTTQGAFQTSCTKCATGSWGVFVTKISPATIIVPTTTTITSAPAVTYPANGVVTVTVSATSGIPTGNVTLTVDGGSPISQVLDGTGTTTFTVTSPSVGNHSLSASYAAQGGFAASGPATGTLVVNGTTATTTTISSPAVTYPASGVVTVTVSSNSGTPTGSVSLSVDGGSPILQVLNGSGMATFTVSGLSGGNHSLLATYASQGSFAGSSAGGLLSVGAANQTISFAAIASQTYGNPPFGISASATSGLAVSFSVSGNCSLTGNTVTITGAGSCMVTASQAGNANYNAAASVSQTVTIAKANQTITWATPANIIYGTALSATQLNATVTAPGTSPTGALTYSPAAGGVLGPGSGQALSVTAAATANYNSATLTVKINVLYASGGVCYGDVGHSILQPINADGSSVWKQGSTVPAKFRVCDINGASIGAAGVVANFVLYRIDSGTITPIDETTVNSTNDLGWHFDSTGQQWIFNMSTKTAPQNVANQTYYYRVDLNDGTSIFFQFGLK